MRSKYSGYSILRVKLENGQELCCMVYESLVGELKDSATFSQNYALHIQETRILKKIHFRINQEHFGIDNETKNQRYISV